MNIAAAKDHPTIDSINENKSHVEEEQTCE